MLYPLSHAGLVLRKACPKKLEQQESTFDVGKRPCCAHNSARTSACPAYTLHEGSKTGGVTEIMNHILYPCPAGHRIECCASGSASRGCHRSTLLAVRKVQSSGARSWVKVDVVSLYACVCVLVLQ